MNIIYRLSSRATPDGTAEVLLRFYAGRGIDYKAHSGIRVPAASWDAKRGRIALPRMVTLATAELTQKQAELDRLSTYLYDRYSRACGFVSPDWLRSTVAEFHGHTASEKRRTLEDAAQAYVKTKDLAAGTRRRYEVIVRWLRAYKPVYLDTIKSRDIEDIEHTLRASGAGHNTISTKLKALRAFTHYACQQGWCKADPFDTYKVPAEVYGSVTFLTPAEREALAQVELPVRLSTQRDIFLFQCWTGCRVSDLYALKRSNIHDGMLEYIPAKTSRSHPVTVRVPLSETAQAIVERYRLHTCGGIFPFLSTDKYNDAIKRILRASGIDRPVVVQDPKTGKPKTVRLSGIATSHLARRTFAECAFLASGSERVVSSMTGHSAKSAALRRYTDVTDEMKLAALKSPDKKPT